MAYVDGYVIPVPRRNLPEYRRIARKCARIWLAHGALQYFECVGDDLNVKTGGLPFPKLVKPKPGETIVFSFIVFKSRAARDRVNGRVCKDPRLAKLMMAGAMPFDVKRMSYGGLKVLVALSTHTSGRA